MCYLQTASHNEQEAACRMEHLEQEVWSLYVEPLNEGHLGPAMFGGLVLGGASILCREVVLFLKGPFSEVPLYIMFCGMARLARQQQSMHTNVILSCRYRGYKKHMARTLWNSPNRLASMPGSGVAVVMNILECVACC